MNSWWQVLGISRDSDRATVRRAYARLLKVTNPEDDPQGFMALREAYENALVWVDNGWNLEPDETGDDDVLPEPQAEAPFAGPVTVGPPLPVDPSSACDPVDPEPDLFAAEQADLRQRIATLEAGLRGPWFKDAPALSAQFEAILSAPAMMAIDMRDSVEHWLAYLLSDTIPRSDPVLLRAIEAFGWDVEGNRPDAVWKILARIDEWRVIGQLESGSHELAAGWRALSRNGVSPLRRRIAALRPGIGDQVRQILALADYQAPGLRLSMNADALAWWERHLATPRFGFFDLLSTLAAVSVPILLLFVAAPAGQRWAGIALFLVLLAIPLLRLKVIAPWRARREQAPDSWVDHGWIGVWLAAALWVIALPSDPVLVYGTILSSGIAVLWMAIVAGRSPRFSNPLGRIFSFGILALIGAVAFFDLSPQRQAALAAFAIGSMLIALFAGPQLVTPFWRIGGRPVLAVTGVIAALLVAALARSLLPTAPPPILPWGVAAIAGMTLLAAVRDVHDGSWAVRAVPWLRWGLWLALVAAVVLSAPPVDRARDDPMASLVDAHPAFATVRTGNPKLYADVAAIAAQIAEGKRNRDEGARAIDRLVTTAYRQRLPLASPSLIASEFDIRLLELRELETIDPRACAGDDRRTGVGKLTEGLQRRHYSHALAVAAGQMASDAVKATGRKIPMPELLRIAANGDTALASRYAAALQGTDVKAKCAARIAVLEALSAQPNADIAATMRPALIAQAAKASGMQTGVQAP